MGRYAVPSFSALWERHETLYVGVFIMALRRLSENGCDATREDDISEQLCPLLNEICYEEGRKCNSEIRTPDWDKPIQPVDRSELKGGKTKKRPDFTCKLVNTFADGADDHEIPFHVECKLLGARTSHNWILNKNYVTEGIKRFDSKSHAYGKIAFSGMMLGYMMSMTPDQILKEVNTYQEKHCVDNPAVEFESIREGIRQYGQRLRRKNVDPREFTLIHLWADLRR